MNLKSQINREDKELILKAKAGDKKAFEKLISEYSQRLFRYLYRMVGSIEDAEDILQETLASAYSHLHQFRGESLFSTWLYRIAINLACKALRERKLDCFHNKVCLREDHNLDKDGIRSVELTDQNPDALKMAIEDDIAERIRQAVARLPARLAEVVTLRELEGCDYHEISNRLGIPVGTVMSRLHRGRLKLAKNLRRMGLSGSE